MPSPAANPLEVSEFHGGKTDNYVDADLSRYQEADNLLVRSNKKFELRPGLPLYDATYYQVPSNDRIGFTILHDDQIFYQSGANLYFPTSSWQTLLGTTGNPAIPGATTASYFSGAIWNKHLIGVSDAFGSPQKIYKDSTGTFRVRNAGLPKITLTACMALALDIKSKFNAHIADSAQHTVAVDAINTTISADPYTFSALVTLVTELLTDYKAHLADAKLAAGRAYHPTQEVVTADLTDSTAPETLADCKSRLDDLKAKYNIHDNDIAHAVTGSHQEALFSAPQISSAGGSGNTYTYTFCAVFTYTIGTVTFRDFGPTHQVTLTNVGAPNANTVTISSIPVIANSTIENFDTATIEWWIYRTATSGTTPFKLTTVVNGTTSATDTSADSAINTNDTIYTLGGVKDNDPPPPAKYVIVANDITWYLHVKEGSFLRKSRIRQSVRFDPDSCPEGFVNDIEEEIVGGGTVDIYPIIFCKNRIYRLEGFRDELGRGSVIPREISRTAGLISHNSIVPVLNGLFFAGNEGWYFTDGFTVQRISQNINDTYKTLISSATQKARIYGKFDRPNNRIYWALMSGSSSTDNDKIFVLDLQWGLSQESCFTTISRVSGGSYFCAMELDASGVLIACDRQGYIFKFDATVLNDLRIDTTLTPPNWQNLAIVWDYKGPAINCGAYALEKYATQLVVAIENVSPISLTIRSNRDDSGGWREIKEIRFRDHIAWLDVDAPVWMPTPDTWPWLSFPMIVHKRHLARKALRFLYKQIEFTNSLTIVGKSDTSGTATTSVAKTVVLNIGANSWPTDVTDYKISFSDDTYAAQYPIISRDSATQITIQDPLGTLVVSAIAKWQLRGIRKKERFNLVSYSLLWEGMDFTHTQYRGVTGGNA